MWHLILSRLGQTLVALVVITALTFALLAAAGGDALSEAEANPRVSTEALDRLRRVYQLDQPLVVRYLRWLAQLVTKGDAGYSITFQAPVARIVWPRFLSTLTLGALALLIAAALALLGAMLSALRPRSLFDRGCGAIIFFASATPRIIIALAALIFLPAALAAPPGVAATSSAGDFSAGMSAVRWLPPALILSVPLVAVFLAQLRDALREALRSDFVRVARAKGLPERSIIRRHALRAALNPVISVAGYSLGGVISGSVVVETVLGWPGLGQLSVTAVRGRDVPLLLGIVLLVSTAVLAGNLLSDILLGLNDPRLRSLNWRDDAAH